MQVTCTLIGVPEADRHRVFSWVEHSFDFRGREAFETTDEVRAAMLDLHEYGSALIAEKRAHPTDDMRLDVRRDPNPLVGFGHGVHHCLGANLARLEMRVMFEELFARFSSFELAGSPEWTRSNKHTGLRHLPVRARERA